MEHARIEKAVFDLFNIERGFIGAPKDKPRKATDCEVRAYAEWLALQAGLYPGFSSSIETVGSWSRQCDNRRTMGVTFGDVLKGRHYCQETRAYIPDQYADGAFSIPLPGRNSHRDTVTMETLGDDLLFFGESTTEWWGPTGDTAAPFQRYSGRRYDTGSAAQNSACRIDPLSGRCTSFT